MSILIEIVYHKKYPDGKKKQNLPDGSGVYDKEEEDMKTSTRAWTMHLLSAALAFALLLVAAVAPAAAETAVPADGTYVGSANGMGGALEVQVTVEGGRITDVTVGSHQETPGISDPAIERIPAAIVAAQSTDVEVVATATVTSNAIRQAVEAALSGEGGEEKAELAIAIEPDVIVVGAGMAGLVASVHAAELGANVLVLEQNYRVGGSANTAGGSISGAGYETQKPRASRTARRRSTMTLSPWAAASRT